MPCPAPVATSRQRTWEKSTTRWPRFFSLPSSRSRTSILPEAHTMLLSAGAQTRRAQCGCLQVHKRGANTAVVCRCVRARSHQAHAWGPRGAARQDRRAGASLRCSCNTRDAVHAPVVSPSKSGSAPGKRKGWLQHLRSCITSICRAGGSRAREPRGKNCSQLDTAGFPGYGARASSRRQVGALQQSSGPHSTTILALIGNTP